MMPRYSRGHFTLPEAVTNNQSRLKRPSTCSQSTLTDYECPFFAFFFGLDHQLKRTAAHTGVILLALDFDDTTEGRKQASGLTCLLSDHSAGQRSLTDTLHAIHYTHSVTDD